MSEIKPILNREAWLEAAVEELRPLFRGHGHEIPAVRVSVGWPSSGGLGKAKRAIGQCWGGKASEDGKPQLFISPLLDAPCAAQGVLATLVHELVHVAVGTEAKHGKVFAKLAEKMMLEGKPTSTSASLDLLERLKLVEEKLGPFPHSKIVPQPSDKKAQTTRMKKAECDCCGFTIRLARKWADIGIPECPVDKKPMTLDARLPDEE